MGFVSNFDIRISSLTEVTPVSSTTQGQNILPTYRIRTMAGDVEALKKGSAPEHKSVIIEKDNSRSDTAGEIPKKIKLSFPKITEVDLETDSPTPKLQNIRPSNQPWTSPKPLTLKPNRPFNAPISKPMPPFESQNMAPPPPPGLPTALVPPSVPPRPLTPPPPPRPVPSMSPTPPNPAPLPPSPNIKTMPPLPPLSRAPIYNSKGGSKKKLVLMAALGAVLTIFIAGEIWWFFLRTPGATPEATVSQNDILPPPQELQPLLPLEEIQPTVNEPGLPVAILSYDRTEVITAEGNTPSAIDAAVEGFGNDSVNSDELVRLVVKTTTSGNPGISEFTTLDDITNGLGLRIPQNVRLNLSDNFDLFVFGANSFDKKECLRLKNTAPSCYGPRLGLAIKISNPTKISAVLKSWEKTMLTDLKPLILAKIGTATSASFLTGIYQEQTIRYKNLPLNTITVEYAVVNDILIITTSKNSMLKSIDSINTLGDSNVFSE